MLRVGRRLQRAVRPRILPQEFRVNCRPGASATSAPAAKRASTGALKIPVPTDRGAGSCPKRSLVRPQPRG